MNFCVPSNSLPPAPIRRPIAPFVSRGCVEVIYEFQQMRTQWGTTFHRWVNKCTGAEIRDPNIIATLNNLRDQFGNEIRSLESL